MSEMCFFMVLDNVSFQSQNQFKNTWNQQEATSLLSSSPRTRRSSTPSRLHGGISRDGWQAGRYFKSADELKHAITTIVECEMGNRLKGYLAA